MIDQVEQGEKTIHAALLKHEQPNKKNEKKLEQNTPTLNGVPEVVPSNDVNKNIKASSPDLEREMNESLHCLRNTVLNWRGEDDRTYIFSKIREWVTEMEASLKEDKIKLAALSKRKS